MQVVYSDESGTGDEKQPLTVVTAILLNMDSQWEPVSTALAGVAHFLAHEKLLHGKNRELEGGLLFKGLRGKVRGVTSQEAAKTLDLILTVAVSNGIHTLLADIATKAGYR